ncbi:hypothetical protein, unlikely [Trypanosoma brucei gambiense DAL972]|uniref:Uncharacterized protein n=1 Tax=Trypanosoma brucei gambiense (strain MHOM/CI/86/DAL972) TaxID=679716 RepID=C9ZXJ9_TRYB9|nr:hypothetical protein, unlikely [Trypanosoma brucei gambiense DAL972]CBH14143.1 hypothetical protein, unlikely [Trypanosoma brucei gambiense DAL972]|eukprot:XP_011776414.1 hypothetical protein, unlikely [Trypanosoma brucei gambiense DAL972]
MKEKSGNIRHFTHFMQQLCYAAYVYMSLCRRGNGTNKSGEARLRKLQWRNYCVFLFLFTFFLSLKYNKLLSLRLYPLAHSRQIGVYKSTHLSLFVCSFVFVFKNTIPT